MGMRELLRRDLVVAGNVWDNVKGGLTKDIVLPTAAWALRSAFSPSLSVIALGYRAYEEAKIAYQESADNNYGTPLRRDLWRNGALIVGKAVLPAAAFVFGGGPVGAGAVLLGEFLVSETIKYARRGVNPPTP